MRDFDAIIVVSIGLIVGLLLGLLIAADASLAYKKEGFNQGFMVQCVGKTGYYWECE